MKNTNTNNIATEIFELHKQYPNDSEFAYFARIKILAWYNLNKED